MEWDGWGITYKPKGCSYLTEGVSMVVNIPDMMTNEMEKYETSTNEQVNQVNNVDRTNGAARSRQRLYMRLVSLHRCQASCGV